MRKLVVFLLAGSLACAAGTRPYEFDWANRNADDRPVLLPLVSADGWTCRATAATATIKTASAHVLFGDGVMHLAYRLNAPNAVVRISPSEPVPVPPEFNTVSLWVWGNHAPRDRAARITISAEFLDADGREFSVDFHPLNHKEWFLLQKRLPSDITARVSKGGMFTGFSIRGGPDRKDRWIELTSFAAYHEELKPLVFKPRPKRGVRIFPKAPQGFNTGMGCLPFPVTQTTIVPIVREDPNIEFRFPSDPTRWDDLAVRVRNGTWMRFAEGGGLFPLEAAKGARVRFHRMANSIVADIEAPIGVKEVRFGKMAATNGAKLIPLPYYSYGPGGDDMFRRPCVVMSNEEGKPFFHLASVDWTQSNGSEIFPYGRPSDGSIGSNGGVRYLPKTDGNRNPVFERFVWSFSSVFGDVLPAIPNPPSPYRELTAEKQWTFMASGDRKRDKAIWRDRRRRGISRLFVNDHELCMRDGHESFTFRTRCAPRKGGDEGMRDFTRFMTDDLGYPYGPYNNYTDLAPVNAWWHADRIARTQDNNLQRAWYRCYAPKPAFINEACEVILTELQRKFRFNTIYCDVHTCVTPWSRTDYDARVPGAGTFAATYYAYGEVLDFQRRTIGGPVWSEGGCHFMYCGLDDGSWAQDQPYRLHVNPWLVDFDLLRIHPLSNNIGMGDPYSTFYPYGWKSPNHNVWIDRFLAATVAFGHQGFLLKGSPEDEDQSYFMLIGTARHYCKADVKDIRYVDADGNLLDTSTAVATDVYRRSQVTVLYNDGSRTAANGSMTDRMTFPWKNKRIVFQPNGFFALSGDGSACTVSGAVRESGNRTDLSVSPEYTYINAYGKSAITPFGGTNGRMYRLINSDGTDEVFLRKGTRFLLPYAAVSVTALDEVGKEIGSVPFAVKAGMTDLKPVKGAFSYRVVKPSAWREPPAKNAVDIYLMPNLSAAK